MPETQEAPKAIASVEMIFIVPNYNPPTLKPHPEYDAF
jgi:hypothetical protein